MAPTSPKAAAAATAPVEDKETAAQAPVKSTPKSEETPVEIPKDAKGIIDEETLDQIREMDDEDEEEEGEGPRAFSKGIVWGFFDQAESTFAQMWDAIEEDDLERLSSLGHFLKGSSAAVGIIKVQAICEKIQHYGHKRDEETEQSLTAEEAMKRIRGLLQQCEKDYKVAKGWLERLYEEEEKAARA